MPPIAWLAIAIAAGVGAVLAGLPAWRSSRDRQTRDLNAERYQAWRGRAVRPGSAPREGMTGDERRRIYAAAALGALGLVALIAFFLTS
jgi:hypothetical protein